MSSLPSPLRVLIAVGSLHVGGTERQILEICRGLRRDEFDVHVVTMGGEGPLKEALEKAGTKVHSLGLRRKDIQETRSERFFRFIRSVPRFRALLREIRPQIIHAFLPEMSIVSAAARWPGKKPPLVISRRSLVHTIARDPAYFRLARWCNGQADLLLANSEAVRADAIRKEGVAEPRIEVIYNGVDTSLYTPGAPDEEARRELGLPPGLQVVGMVANLHAYKGHEEVLQAAAALRDGGTRCALLFIGRDGNASDDLRRAVADLRLAPVVLAGARDDVPEMLRLMDVFVSASHEEGFSNSILEAMAAGRAIVATAVGGNVEQIEDGVNGLLVPPRAPHALAAAIGRLLADKALRVKLGAAARHTAVTSFGLDLALERTAALYRRLCLRPEDL